MTQVIETSALSKHYKAVKAVNDLTVSFDENRIHGLLGRNGAGKTTLMQLLTGQLFATSGDIWVFGESPLENTTVMQRTCFIQEGQTYPDGFEPRHVISIAAGMHEKWDQQRADELVEMFELPMKRKIKKLSRGQLSAIGIIVGIASRADLTFFDEPYLGLDAVARKNFYDALLADYAEHPRTILISSHHIDEVAPLLETVTVIDNGELLMQHDVDELADAAFAFAGTRAAVDQFTGSVQVLERTDIGGLSTVVVRGPITQDAARLASDLRLDKSRASLQDLFVAVTESARKARQKA
ncbi:MAG: ABC transporter ATP-binding protein [Agrococcus casei]|uniref:ABC transporter ATP-binding protein n=1 Tax=Agrococcus casei TaxID=343512 RepID=UPI003F8ECFC6